jgi:hypothetical protein
MAFSYVCFLLDLLARAPDATYPSLLAAPRLAKPDMRARVFPCLCPDDTYYQKSFLLFRFSLGGQQQPVNRVFNPPLAHSLYRRFIYLVR